ncbi:DUF2637 domain-containing protein [Streptomyces blattellae]|uniref:DUF2637 domain-containing protein n=1 Tax=Streptomyces blattellae TaxID=2569855 RepID=UPI0012B78FCF|nr:DUF2637 domain-containing protein [Streptomyces blattellae]
MSKTMRVLTLVTCGLNIAAGHDVWAKVAHGTMPLLWVVFCEIGAHIYAVRIGAATGCRMEKIRFSRWFLAPLSTFALWRRMTLWEVTSYSRALACERERLLARADLHERYGWKWRWKTPRRERVMLRTGELTPAGDDVPVSPKPEQAPEKPKSEAPKPPRMRPTTGKTKTAQRTTAELLAEARTVTADWTDAQINAEALRKELHCGSRPARQVRDALLAERASGRVLHPVDNPEPDASGDGAEGVAA